MNSEVQIAVDSLNAPTLDKDDEREVIQMIQEMQGIARLLQENILQYASETKNTGIYEGVSAIDRIAALALTKLDFG